MEYINWGFFQTPNKTNKLGKIQSFHNRTKRYMFTYTHIVYPLYLKLPNNDLACTMAPFF